MKLDQQFNEVEQTDVLEEGIDFSIDEQSLGVLFKGFSDTLYSDKIGSIVREITSNCFDSHVEAGVNIPVRIEITEPDYAGSGSSVIFTDFGMGLSPERVRNIYSKYFSSTKRTTNNQIGGFGIGAKSPLSYTEAFYVNTVSNKTEYKYIVHRGSAVPRIELISKEAVDKKNQTSIIIPLKKDNDRHAFVSAMRTQLKYFDNIDYINCGIDNEYKVFKGKHFIIRADNKYKSPHVGSQYVNDKMGICLGKVNYPLNYSQVGLYEYSHRTPLSLLFEVGELPVTMNREMIEYTEEAIETIKKRYDEARAEIHGIINQSTEVDSLKSYLAVRNQKGILMLEDYFFPIGEFGENIKYTLKGFPAEITIPHDPFYDFSIENRIEKGKVKKFYGSVRDLMYSDKAILYRLNGNLSKRKSLYLEEIEKKGIYILKMSRKLPSDAYKNLGISTLDNKEELKAKYDSLILKDVLERSKSYDRTDVPQAWIDNYVSNLKNIRSTTINDNIVLRYARWNSYNNVMEFNIYDEKVSEHYKNLKSIGIVVYGFQGEESKLQYPFSIFMSMESYFKVKYNTKRRMGVIIKLAKDNVKYFEDLPNFIHVDQFHKKYKSMIARVKLYYEIQRSDFDKILDATYKLDYKKYAEWKVLSIFNKRFNFFSHIPLFKDASLDDIPVYIQMDKKIYDLRKAFKEVMEFDQQYPLIKALDKHTIKEVKKDAYKYLYAIKKSTLNYYIHE